MNVTDFISRQRKADPRDSPAAASRTASLPPAPRSVPGICLFPPSCWRCSGFLSFSFKQSDRFTAWSPGRRSASEPDQSKWFSGAELHPSWLCVDGGLTGMVTATPPPTSGDGYPKLRSVDPSQVLFRKWHGLPGKKRRKKKGWHSLKTIKCP